MNRAVSVKNGQNPSAQALYDHIIDLQLGGNKSIDNLAPLSQSANRCLGVQIKNAIKKYPVGTVIGNFIIE